MATYMEQLLAKLKEFERCVGWMYQDTAGKVTVGVGLMLPDGAAAEALPFQVGGRAASAAEIGAEFARVGEMAIGRSAAFYRRPGGGVELLPGTIDARLRGVLEEFEGRLRASLAGYDALPDGAKMALLDMAYNLGPTGLLLGYPRLIGAVERGDWAVAAACCLRHGPSAERNAWTRQQFLGAVVGAIRAEAELWWKRLAWGLVGMVASLLEAGGRQDRHPAGVRRGVGRTPKW